LIFFPDGLASALWRRHASRRPQHAAGAAATADVEAGIAAFCAATGSHGPAAGEPGSLDIPILQIENVCRSYDALRAVDGVSLEVAPRSLHGLMGPNGAGKTTLFNIVSGFITADRGQVLLAGAALDKVPLEQRIGLGMTRTFQHAAVFRRLSCLDNVIIGLGRNTIVQGTRRSIAAAFDGETVRAERQAAAAALAAVGLGARAEEPAGALSLGDQRRLEIARAIVSRPRLILLDEPVSGVSAEEAQNLRALLLAINRELGVAMLVIEHNIGFLVSLCQRVSVMSEGRILAEGDAAAMVSDPRVRHAYFGERQAAA
jgi:ABC-type branched-subunit amino acid transport system ATPase component